MYVPAICLDILKFRSYQQLCRVSKECDLLMSNSNEKQLFQKVNIYGSDEPSNSRCEMVKDLIE